MTRFIQQKLTSLQINYNDIMKMYTSIICNMIPNQVITWLQYTWVEIVQSSIHFWQHLLILHLMPVTAFKTYKRGRSPDF